jgi:hypothetical protein
MSIAIGLTLVAVASLALLMGRAAAGGQNGPPAPQKVAAVTQPPASPQAQSSPAGSPALAIAAPATAIATPTPVRPTPTSTPTAAEAWNTAAETALDPLWGKDWPRAIAVIDGYLANWSGHEPARTKLCAALVNYGGDLLKQGRADDAVGQLVRAQSLGSTCLQARATLTALTPTATPRPPPTVAPTITPTVQPRSQAQPANSSSFGPDKPMEQPGNQPSFGPNRPMEQPGNQPSFGPNRPIGQPGR